MLLKDRNRINCCEIKNNHIKIGQNEQADEKGPKYGKRHK